MAETTKWPIFVETIEMHTAGEPFRIVKSGYPDMKGKTILEKIRYLRENLDMVRKMLMNEPRGHVDMYGGIPVPGDEEGVDIGIIFIHNGGYGSMCGHGVMSLARYVIDHGIIADPVSPETKINIQCPCGIVETFVEYNSDLKKSGRVRFNSVPSFIVAKDVDVKVPGYTDITVDIVFGGQFYAIVPASQYGLDIFNDNIETLRKAGVETTNVLRKEMQVTHPENKELAYIFGTILTDDNTNEAFTATCNVFGDGQVDRSPSGSGTTARVTQMYFRNKLKLVETRTFRGPAGGYFRAKPVREVQYGPYSAVVVEVSGKGYYTGTATYTLEDEDAMGRGFGLQKI